MITVVLAFIIFMALWIAVTLLLKLHPRAKSKIFTEFKSTLLDNDYQRIKMRMVEEICGINGTIIFSSHTKKKGRFDQKTKESVYIHLVSKIVRSVNEKVSVVFDSFGKKDFEERIVNSVSQLSNTDDITPGDSEKTHGLQFADNISSVIRLHKSDDPKSIYYELIKKIVREV